MQCWNGIQTTVVFLLIFYCWYSYFFYSIPTSNPYNRHLQTRIVTRRIAATQGIQIVIVFLPGSYQNRGWVVRVKVQEWWGYFIGRLCHRHPMMNHATQALIRGQSQDYVPFVSTITKQVKTSCGPPTRVVVTHSTRIVCWIGWPHLDHYFYIIVCNVKISNWTGF